jgi:hypothetical protein
MIISAVIFKLYQIRDILLNSQFLNFQWANIFTIQEPSEYGMCKRHQTHLHLSLNANCDVRYKYNL